MTCDSTLRTVSTVFLLVLAGCNNDLTLPSNSGSGLDLSQVHGDGQKGTVGAPLPSPLVVRVVSSGGAGVAGRRVAFLPVGEGLADRLEPDTALTNSSGEASSVWVLGTQVGERQVEAHLVADDDAPEAVTFRAEAIAAAPDTLSGASALNRAGRRGAELSDPLVVRVADRFGNPVPGAVVSWAVAAGNGKLSGPESATGADGTTAVFWELGDQVGVQKVTATMAGLHGSPVTFTAVVLF
jgi:Big-like domain-containing protein